MSPRMLKLSSFTAVFLCGVAGLAEPFPFDLPVAHSYLTFQSFMFHLHSGSNSAIFCLFLLFFKFSGARTILTVLFYNCRNRFKVGLLRSVLTPARFHYAHTHCPSHHPHLCCCHSLFTSRLQYTLNMFRSRSQRQSNQCFV